MKRELFLTNPQAIWVQTPRKYESAAEYAEPFHHVAGRSGGYSRAWWAVVLGCAFAGLLLTAMT